ncbi:MAG: DUF4276 family protein [Tannerellaceae bacterium]|jgi:hypothetical protein|nr:DUF4276 family protein [Tannerellaceae bacterium]
MMHIEFLIEDQSGKKAMDILIPKILGNGATYKIHSYKGIGHLPKGLHPKSSANKRILLDQLLKLLCGYGKTPGIDAVIIVCDLDDKDKEQFLSELNRVLDACHSKPKVTYFCLAIEEFEAWYLGDLDAIRKAYPQAKNIVLNGYINDSICGTWELLADAIYKGGHQALLNKGWQIVGQYKSMWAEAISLHMNVEENKSPSFQIMYTRLKKLILS